MAEPGEGRVLVVDGGGSMRRSMVGGNVAAEAAANGWAAIIVYGAVRDTVELRDTAIAVFALGTVPRKTSSARDVEMSSSPLAAARSHRATPSTPTPTVSWC